ncbi:MAG: hypothetical protein L0211_13895 [Planctomycetaceae bacterium]|nr:hypothetical protein [Planctomycetaceae bacterium]
MKPALRHRPFQDLLDRSIATIALLVVGLLLPITGCRKAAESPVSPRDGPPDKGTSKVNASATPAMPPLESGDAAQLRPEELKVVLEDIPKSLRRDGSDVQLARDLGIRAWVIDYSGASRC